MLWLIFILLFILEANNVAIPWIAWCLAYIFLADTVLNVIIRVLEKRNKKDEKE